MDLGRSLGFRGYTEGDDSTLVEYLNVKLSALGKPIFGKKEDYHFLQMSESILANLNEKNKLLKGALPPVDQRIQSFLDDALADVVEGEVPRLPSHTLILERHGLARTLSLPPDQDSFKSDIVESYRVKQGVLHNPKHDRRTTKGVFHIADYGFPVPADKIALPKNAYAKLLELAFQPPLELRRLPFTESQEEKADSLVSLLLRPMVVPEIPGKDCAKSMEIRFVVPGNLVSNLDFVESIFGNAGDPFLAENNAALDPVSWTGHTGYIILAPHLTKVKKKDLGLPHISEATERQKRDGMCWSDEDELYNNGGAFKATLRDRRGIMVTLIADNYFGYSKKEVKTQISMSANLYGLAEEEHSGGALAYPSYDLGEDFLFEELWGKNHLTLEDVKALMGNQLEWYREGYAVDKTYPDICYVSEKAYFDLQAQMISWKDDSGTDRSIRLKPDITYVLPSGYKVEMHKPAKGRRWRLIGTVAEGTFCHKPCTVSGGGKSEISKSIADAILHGIISVVDVEKDFDRVEEILNYCFGYRFRDNNRNKGDASRPILSKERSLGSVIKLLTPSSEYNGSYNAWLKKIPFYVKDLVFLVKRYYRSGWGENWRHRFSVDDINGRPGRELKYRDSYIRSHYLRIGYNENGGWRTFSLRKDFNPAAKVQTEDDISASVVCPASRINYLADEEEHASVKFIYNCEYRLFQRPDEAIHRGYDKTTESDYTRDHVFFSNYQALDRDMVKADMEESMRFSRFTQPMQELFEDFAVSSEPDYLVSSAHPRMLGNVMSKNPRYLQDRPDLIAPRDKYMADLGTRLSRRIPLDKTVPHPVNAVLAGRRNNPPEEGVRSLCVYNPIHYQDLPELFMDFIASLTGKSPSTTGAGSEGALTKGPFNALPQIIDLNNALVSYLVTGQSCFTSAAGWVGPKYKVDHDISLLVPELWSRMKVNERDPQWLIEHGYLEQCKDFEHNGETILASRLGWRINEKFVREFMGRVFSNPKAVFTDEMLKPELQSEDIYIDGIDNIVSTQKRVAELYFEDGTIEMACPPLKALLHIMVDGEYEGKTINDPEIRALFDSKTILEQDWYVERLKTYQAQEIERWTASVAYLTENLENNYTLSDSMKTDIVERLEDAKERLGIVSEPEYLDVIRGTIGTDPAAR